MCGIAGFATNAPSGIAEQVVRNASRQLEHRGPDDFGFLSRNEKTAYLGREFSQHVDKATLTLVHRRLAIQDLSDAGWQPMSSDDGRYVIVFNGEIYNFLELRSKLIAAGHQFQSDCDTEVLLAGYAHWKHEVLNHLVGMFAFAILDNEANRLFLARDFFGIKPLYYTNVNGQFSFASEIPVLLENASIGRQVNPNRLFLYLRYGVTDHGAETLFQHIQQLPAAHYLDVDLNDLSASDPVRYWQPRDNDVIDVSFDEATQTVRQRFLENVELHLTSDVPVGAALSGGIDSSAIVMAMRHIYGEKIDLELFSFIPSEPAISEERWVDLVGRASLGRVHKVSPTQNDIADDIHTLIATHGEPVASSSTFAQYHVFRAAKEAGIPVILDGQGADELFAGYRLYAGARLASLLRHGQFAKAVSFLRRVSKYTDTGMLGYVMHAADCLLPKALQKPLRSMVGREAVPKWLHIDWFRERHVAPSFLKLTKNRDVLRSQLWNSIEQTTLPHLLRFEDRNSMAFSIESRVPFLTPGLASYVLSLPEHFLVSDEGVSKCVLREAMRGIVPSAVLDRRDKIGFATPEKSWLAKIGPWVNEALNSEAAHRIPVFSATAIAGECKSMLSSNRRCDGRIWRWLNLIKWSEQFAVQYN